MEQRCRADARPLGERSPYEQSFRQCMNLWEDFPDVRPLSFHPRIGEAAARLAGVACLRLWHDQALYKEPGGRQTDAHNDQPYWPMDETDTITAWIPFDGSTLEAGAITESRLVVRANVPGMEQARFVECAEDAKANCPVSKLLNATISLEATLA